MTPFKCPVHSVTHMLGRCQEMTPKPVFRPRFDQIIVDTTNAQRIFNAPVRSSDVAEYIGISLDSFIQQINPHAYAGSFVLTVNSPTGSPQRIGVRYVRKERPAGNYSQETD